MILSYPRLYPNLDYTREWGGVILTSTDGDYVLMVTLCSVGDSGDVFGLSSVGDIVHVGDYLIS